VSPEVLVALVGAVSGIGGAGLGALVGGKLRRAQTTQTLAATVDSLADQVHELHQRLTTAEQRAAAAEQRAAAEAASRIASDLEVARLQAELVLLRARIDGCPTCTPA